MTSTTAQPGIFAQGTRAHYHLEFDLRAGADAAGLARALAGVREPSVTAGGFNLVVGFGPAAWAMMAGPGDVPEALAPFEPVGDPAGRHAPSTQHDLWVWLHGTGPDLAFAAAVAVAARFEPVATMAVERAGFVYQDSRDLTGFIDGTENPPVHEAPEVALVPPGQPGAGGAHAITMRWVHDLGAFNRLAVEEQERVIGRTKPASIELDDDVRPPTSHVSRVVVETDGEELEIYRRSVPYGDVAEHGLYFVAFSADPARFGIMLARMFATSGDGLHDRLTEFTRPVSGSSWFVPSLDALERALDR